MVTAKSARPRAESRSATSAELTRLLRRAAAGPLSVRESEALAHEYRLGASALLRARATGDVVQAEHLEGLMRAAYALVYAAPPPRSRWATVARFISRDFPRLVRAERRLVALAVALLLAGALCGAAVVWLDPGALAVVVPDTHQEQTPTERVRQEAQRDLFDAGSSAVFSSFLFTHNIQVTFLVLALGLTAGIGTAAVLFWNGIPLGALAAQYGMSGQWLFFWAWILPHGVTELSVVAIAGAAGFVLARGLLRPGNLTRGVALQREARRAVSLVLGGMPLLIVAGLVEGSVSQLHPPLAPLWLKLGFAAALALATLSYLARAGRADTDADRFSARAAD
ncbi:MAG TPA: stage II sporulation protein M [Polyangiales bacterium]